MRPARPVPAPVDPAPHLWEQAAALFVMLMLTGALIGPIFAPTQEETPILRLVWLPVYGIIAGLLLYRFERVLTAWPAWIVLGLLVILAFASKYWSIDPATTTRRVIALTISGSFAMYLGTVFGGRHLPRLLAHGALLMGVGSLVMIAAFPAIGIHQDVNAGLWRGLWYEKNQMGFVMVAGAIGAAACLAQTPEPGQPRRWMAPAVALLLAALLVLGTQSKTSLLCLMGGCGLIGGLWALRQGGPVFSVVMVWLGVVAAAVGVELWMTESAEILTALGKDPSLTGRTDIWESLMRRVAERPWTGFGYSAFWGLESTPAAYVRLETGWLVPSAHNGWIDLLVQLGWPGAVVVALVMASASILSLLRLGGLGRREGYWSLGYLAVFTLLSLSESVLLSPQSLPWTLCMAILARAVAPDPLAARAARLAPEPRAPYQSRSRIASDYAHGPARRSPLPVR